MAEAQCSSVAMAAVEGIASIYFNIKLSKFSKSVHKLLPYLRGSTKCWVALLAACGTSSGIELAATLPRWTLMLLLLLPEVLMASLGHFIVSFETRLIPLSVFMLPHLLNLRIFDSGGAARDDPW